MNELVLIIVNGLFWLEWFGFLILNGFQLVLRRLEWVGFLILNEFQLVLRRLEWVGFLILNEFLILGWFSDIE